MQKTEAKNSTLSAYLTYLWSKYGKIPVLFVVFAIMLSVTGVSGIYSFTRGRARAVSPSTLNFQGRLLSNTGAVVADGTYNIQFNLYTVSTAGTTQWTESYLNTTTPVTLKYGYFSVPLGSLTSFPSTINWDQEQWLGMTVRGTGSCAFAACTPTDAEMTPRFKLTAVPYAFRAGSAAAVASNNTSTASTNSDAITVTSGNANGLTSNSGSITIDAGTATQTTGQLLLGTANASALTIGRAGVTTTLQGSVSLTGAGVGLAVTNNATIGGTLAVTGTQTFTGLGTFNGGLTVATGSTFTNASSTLFTAIAITDKPTGGAIGTAAVTVDVATTFNVNQTTASQTLTLPSPTVTTAGRIAFVNNIGSTSFTMHGSVVNNGGAASFIWNGTSWVTNLSLNSSVVTSIGTIDSQTKSANGAVIASNALVLQTADATNVGLVSIGAQTLAGAKTFNTAASFTAAGTGLAVTNNATVGGTLIITGNITASANLTVGSGAGVGLFTNNGATLNTTLAVGDDSDGGSLGGTPLTPLTAAASVDVYTAININQTTAGQTITLPSPTTASAGRVLYISNVGTASFIISGTTISTGSTSTLVWNGTAWSFAGAGGSGVTTIGAISGTPTANGGTITGTTLNLAVADGTNGGVLSAAASAQTIGGTKTFSGAVTISQLLTGNAGATISGAATSINASSNFATNINTGTSTGVVSIGNSAAGAITIQSASTIGLTGTTTATGLTGGSSTAFTIATGATTNVGLVVRAAASQTADLLQVQNSAGYKLLAVSAAGNIDALGYYSSPFGGMGSVGNIITNSDEISIATGWAASNTALFSDLYVSPDGSTTADACSDTAVGGFCEYATSTAVGSTYTFSIWARKATAGTTNVEIRIDGTTTGTGTSATYTLDNNTYQRISVTQNTSGFTGNVKVRVYPNGTGGSATAALWGAQLVAGSNPGVYTRTGASAVAAGGGVAVNGNLTVGSGGNVAFQRNGIDITSTGTQNNLAIGNGALFRFTNATALTITGITGGSDGRRIILVNAGSSTVILNDNDAGSTAANRMVTGTGGSVTMSAGSSIELVYDSSTSVWRVTSAGAVTGGYIQNQSSASQTANFRITGSGQADTSLLAPSFQNSLSGTLSVGTTANTTALTLGSANLTGTLNIDSGAGSTIAIGTSASIRTVSIGTGAAAQAVTVGSTNSTSTLTLQAGTGALNLQTQGTGGINIGTNAIAQTLNIGNTTTTTAVNILAGSGNINLNAGTVATNQTTINLLNTTATTVNAFGAATSITLGATTGTLTVRNANQTFGNAAGSGLFTNNGATLNTTLQIADVAAGGAIGTAAATVDVYTSISVLQTTAGRTLTIAAPTSNPTTIFGRTLYLSNIGTTSFTLGTTTVNPGTTATLVWSNTDGVATTGETWQFAGADGSGILNQSSADQTANFRVSGTGRANTSITTPLVDSITGALSIGTSTATGITIGSATNNSAITIDSGTGAVNIGTGAQARTTSIATGAAVQTVTLGSVNSTSSLTLQSGTGALNLQTQGTGGINIGTNAVAQVITLGNSTGASQVVLNAGTAGVNIGANGVANTLQIGNTSGAVAQTINIGNNATASSTSTVVVGSTVAGAVTLQSATAVNINAPSLVTNATTLAVFNTNATTVTAFQAGTSISIGATTGTLTVRNANQTFGNAAGSGLFTNNGATLNTTLAVGDDSDGGALGGTPASPLSAAASVDVYTAISINQTTGGQTITLPSPTVATAGRILYISNIGSTSFILGGVTISNGGAQSYLWNGSAWVTTTTNIGVTSVGAISGTPTANGGTITGTTLNLAVADGTNGGVLSAAASPQTIGGAKTFSGAVTVQGLLTGSLGATISGANILLNDSSNFNTSINTGTSVGNVTIGNATNAANTVTVVAGATNGINLNAPTIATNATTLALFNTNASTVTALQAATSISIGATTGSLTVRNANQTFGNAAGSGLFTNNGATLNATLQIANLATGGAIGTAAATVDIYTSFAVLQTTTLQTVTIPTPTTSPTTLFGRVIYVANIGTTSFTLGGATINPGTTATLVWSNTDGAATTGETWQFAGADGNGILNQSTADQTANFRISGTGRANTSITTPLIDSITGALSIGTGTATGITIGGAATTGTIAIGNAGIANILQIGNTTGAVLQTINIGNNATGSSTTTLNIGSTVGTSAVTIAAGTGAITFNAAQAQFSEVTGTRTLTVQTRTTNVAGTALTISGGSAGTGAAAFTGGQLTLQGGNAGGTGNANGANVSISGGTGVGTGVKGLVVIDTPTFNTAAAQNFTANANITQANIDNLGGISLTESQAGWTATLTDPTITTAGRVIYITNSGTFDITLAANTVGVAVSIGLKPASTATMFWNGADWTAAGASSSTDLQAAYNNTATSAGGAELVLNASGGAADGLTVRNNATTPIIGGIFEAQTSVGSNIFSVNNNAAEFAVNGGSETSTNYSTNWLAAPDGGTVSRTTTTPASTVATGVASTSVVTTATAAHGARNLLSSALTYNLKYNVSYTVRADSASAGFNSLETMYSSDGTATAGNVRACVAGTPTYFTGTASQAITTITGVGTTFTAGMVGQIFVFANGTSALITGFTNATTLTTSASYSQTVASQSYNMYNAGNTVNAGSWSRVTCTFIAPSSGTLTNNSIFIRQTDATARTYYVDNLSVTISADANHAVDGSADDSTNFATNWTAAPAGGTVTRTTATLYDTSASAQVVTTAVAGHGMRNNLTITPSVSTQYLVTFYAKSTNTFNDIRVRYSRDGGTNFVSCADYNTQNVSTTGFTRITCLLTTDGTIASNPDLMIEQTAGTARTFYVDALTITLNTNNSNNVQVGAGSRGGPITLFTLDRAGSAPIAANNDAYLGSMYYDTTSGRIQCYEADGWGACGSAPDNYVNLNPEYAGAVLNGTGVGTMTADFCANQTGVLQVNTTLCATGESRNFYKWTSPQATDQTYSVYVSYQLPATFKGFSSDDTVQLTGRTDNTTNGSVSYEMFKSESGALTACGSATTVTTTVSTWQTVGINGNESTSCSFTSSSANAFVIFKINVTAKSNANVYVGTLGFTTTGR